MECTLNGNEDRGAAFVVPKAAAPAHLAVIVGSSSWGITTAAAILKVESRCVYKKGEACAHRGDCWACVMVGRMGGLNPISCTPEALNPKAFLPFSGCHTTAQLNGFLVLQAGGGLQQCAGAAAPASREVAAPWRERWPTTHPGRPHLSIPLELPNSCWPSASCVSRLLEAASN